MYKCRNKHGPRSTSMWFSGSSENNVNNTHCKRPAVKVILEQDIIGSCNLILFLSKFTVGVCNLVLCNLVLWVVQILPQWRTIYSLLLLIQSSLFGDDLRSKWYTCTLYVMVKFTTKSSVASKGMNFFPKGHKNYLNFIFRYWRYQTTHVNTKTLNRISLQAK